MAYPDLEELRPVFSHKGLRGDEAVEAYEEGGILKA